MFFFALSVGIQSAKDPVKMTSRIGVGIIGCGSRVRNLAKGVLARDPSIRVTALCDPLPESIVESRNVLQAQDATEYENYHDLVRSDQVDWVMIGSWNRLHKEHAVAAFEAGKHVFCEKPLAVNLDDCLAIRDAWQRSGKQFIIGFTLRYSPHYRKIRELVSGGAIGRIISLEFNETLSFSHGGYIMGDWRRLRKLAGTHLLEKCCHDLDIANWLLESCVHKAASFGGLDFFVPKNAYHMKRLGTDAEGRSAYRTWPGTVLENPFTTEKDILDNQVAILQYGNGARATFHTNCNAGIPERRMYICGTEGAIRSDVRIGRIELQRIGFDEPLQDLSTEGRGGHGGGDSFLTESIADCMRGNGKPLSTLEDGLRAAIACFGVDAAQDSGQLFDLSPLWEKAGIELL